MFNLNITAKQYDLIHKWILKKYPEEAVGFLTQDSFIGLKNIASEPLNSFEIDPIEYAKYGKEAIALIHSHCQDSRNPPPLDIRTPSWTDIENQKRSAIPWLIFGTEGSTVTSPIQWPRVKNNNYLKRPFIWFVNDCYTLIQDWYEFELGIILPDHKANAEYLQYRQKNNLFDNYLEDYGFKEVEFSAISRGDILLLDNKGYKRNHLGIYTGNSVIHQDMLSVEVPFETFIGRINAILRYES